MFSRLSKVVPLMLVLVLLAISAVPALAAPPGPTIVEVAIAVNSDGQFAGQFDTLIAAVLAADPAVVNTLSGNGQFTVFAPTDGAFEDLLEELDLTAEALLKDQKLVTAVLLYHVAPGRRDSSDVLDSDRIRTLLKGKDGFLFQDSGVLTDNLGRTANIIVPDVPAANGIIHAIDAVVLPYAP